jgi:hypothetical protein
MTDLAAVRARAGVHNLAEIGNRPMLVADLAFTG